MKLLVLAALTAVAVADVRHLNLQYGLPGNNYDGRPNSGLTNFFEVSPTTPSPLLRLPVHEAQDFNAQITNLGASGFSTPSPIISSGFSFTTPAPSIVSSTPAPNVEINSFSTPINNLNLRASLVQQSTPAPSIDLGSVQFGTSSVAPSFLNSLPFNSFRNYNFGINEYSTPTPVLNAGSGQLTSIDSSLFNRDSAINSVRISTIGGSIDDAFGVSTPSSVSDELYHEEPVAPQVSKHVYFFAAPEEPEPIRPRIRFYSQPKKNVKYIFIKAPSPPQIAPVQIAAPPQNEEKTVVYVLVKKTDDNQEIQVHQPAPTNPPKPEVYFIKYKNQKEAEEAVNRVQEGKAYSGSQTSASDLGDSNFFGTLNPRINVKAEPIVSYVKSSSPIQEPSFNPNSYISSSVSPFVNSGFGFTTPVPISNFNLHEKSFNSLPLFNSGLHYSTPVPIQFNSGLSFSTPTPDVKLLNTGLSGLDLASRTQVVDTPNINQNVIETSIESSTVAPQKIAIRNNLVLESGVSSTVAPETFVSSTVIPQTIETSYNNVPSVLSERNFGIYQSSPPNAFKVYGLPNLKK